MYKDKKVICVIPARLSSSRFPNKPLAKINGREMVLRVADIAKQSKYLDGIVVATENKIIKDLCNDNDYLSIVTDTHYTCTHRVAEVSENLKCDYVFNLQGDEPLTDPKWIDDMIVYGIDNNIDVLQSSRELEPEEIDDEELPSLEEDLEEVEAEAEQELEIPEETWELVAEKLGLEADDVDDLVEQITRVVSTATVQDDTTSKINNMIKIVNKE